MISDISPAAGASPIARRAFFVLRSRDHFFLARRRGRYYGLPTAALDSGDPQPCHLRESVSGANNAIAAFSPSIDQARFELIDQFDGEWGGQATHFLVYRVNLVPLYRLEGGLLVPVDPMGSIGYPDISMEHLAEALKHHETHSATVAA